jgi:hypothetical protein
MKIERKDAPPIVIGKRVTLGAAILGVANALAHFFPEQAPAILAIATPTIFVVQLVVANKFGVTQ